MAIADVTTTPTGATSTSRVHVDAPGPAAPPEQSGIVPTPRTRDAAHAGRRMLVCLDGSPLAEVCVPLATSLARTFGTAITLVLVMQPQRGRLASRANDALGWEISRQEARAYLERLQQQVGRDVRATVDVRLEQGRPAERIVDVAREIKADLIMLGTRGDGGTAMNALGSTLLQVLAEARSSLFIAHAGGSAPAGGAPRLILVPLDGSSRSESVLPVAARIAGAHGSTLLLVHVVQEPLHTALLPAAEDMELALRLAGRLAARASEYLARIRLQIAHEAPLVRTLVIRHASASQCLLEVSQRENADLIVLSAHGSACDSTRSFGSVTASLLTHTTVPLLTLQDLPECGLRRARDSDAPHAPVSPRASYAAESV